MSKDMMYEPVHENSQVSHLSNFKHPWESDILCISATLASAKWSDTGAESHKSYTGPVCIGPVRIQVLRQFQSFVGISSIT